MSQVHPARVQHRNARRQVASRTPNVGGLRNRRSIAQLRVHTRHSGRDPLHRRAPATHGIATAGARHIQTARRCHARKFGIKHMSSEAPSNVLSGPTCRTPDGRGQRSVERSGRVGKIAKSDYQPGHVCCLLPSGYPLASRQQCLFDKCLLLYVQSCTPDDGRKDRPKHVECHSKNIINLMHWCILLVLLQKFSWNLIGLFENLLRKSKFH